MTSSRLLLSLFMIIALVVLEPLVESGSPLAAGTDVLASEFSDPPHSARPRVWWHWMNGNVSEEGVVKDLAWMKRIGIGGLQHFDAGLATPQVVEQRQTYMSAGWRSAFRVAVEEADRLGLEFGIASSPGWSQTGGPWVPPEDGMKKLVWSEVLLEGGQELDSPLPEPPAVTGPFQSIRRANDYASIEIIPETFYRDVAVIAYPIVAPSSLSLPDVVMVDGEAIPGEALWDEDFNSGIPLPSESTSSPATIQFEYPAPQTVRSAVIYLANVPGVQMQGPMIPRLEVSKDGLTWRTVTEIELGELPVTVSFPPQTARHFRLILERGESLWLDNVTPPEGYDPTAIMALAAGGTPSKAEIRQFRLSPEARVHAFEQKAGFEVVDEYYPIDVVQDGDDTTGIDPKTVLDLTANMQPDGRLDWVAPEGQWKILRLGYTLTGSTNHPPAPEAMGLEVDKFDAEAVSRYLVTYLDKFRDIVGDDLVGKRGLQVLLNDSSEAGPANWTPRMQEKFGERRGYDLLPWLPALTGDIVGSRQESDAFLYDFRRTLGELMATEHYGTVAKVSRKYGLTLYGESLEGNRQIGGLGDDIELRRFADIPMGAIWTYSPDKEPTPSLLADLRGAASTAHIYGQSIVASESLTSVMQPWAHSPADLQPVIDLAFLHGINRPVLHTSVHQPLDDKKPGLSLAIFGQFFNRHESWGELAGGWVDYLARNSYLLQQGKNVADVAYFYGEETPISILARRGYPEDVPTRYAYDFMPPHALREAVSIDNGDLITEGGSRYKVLYLSGTSEFMTLPILRRIAELVEDGATVVGHAPQRTPALQDDLEEFQQLKDKLWTGEVESSVGGGRVIASRDVESALQGIGVQPAFDHDAVDADIQFVQRRLDDGDLYFVANRGAAREFEAYFRTSGRKPEIWSAVTGERIPVSYRIEGNNTAVPLTMKEMESFFVVLREPAESSSLTVEVPDLVRKADIGGPWKVHFQSGRGAPENASFSSLASLHEHVDAGIRYFSGISSYRNTFNISERVNPDQSLLLDLGKVAEVAEVLVNGSSAGHLWKAPYRVDIGDLVRPGSNDLEIRVANRWVNRLIGDQQAGIDKITYTTVPTFTADAPLRPSGLIGPVMLWRTE